VIVALVVATVAAVLWLPRDAVVPPTNAADRSPATTPAPKPRPDPGHEVYGFVPYWEMDDGIAAHLRATPLTTLALFSVTNTSSGAISTRQAGYRLITSVLGEQLIREAHERGVRVELVYTSFGRERNGRLLADRELQDATIAALVQLGRRLGLDGINVDVESIDPADVAAFGAFVGRLRGALVAADPSDRVSVATTANVTGAAMAAAAAAAGADRIFLMGYDYHWAGSGPGASAPLDRRDGDRKDLPWSLDLYRAAGVPLERTLLGLPLYGMAWPVTGPELGAPRTGRGKAWIPRRNLDLLRDASIVPVRDDIEMVELYALASGGVAPGPSRPPGSSPDAARDDRTWRAVYVDSPATLAPKLALATGHGLAGAGFWAIGYERGLPAYTDLIARFAAGEPME
jgi:spore germination protein YaaH